VFKSQAVTESGQAFYWEQRIIDIRKSYRRLFNSAKSDMLATAMRKGRITAPVQTSKAGQPVTPTEALPKRETPPTPKKPEPQPVLPLAPTQKPEPQPMPAPVKPAPTAAQEGKLAQIPPNMPGTGLIEMPKREAGAKKVVVYDFDSTDQYRTVALILTEALREEVFKMKQFVLVNREDLQKVLEEMALQQTGLIDDKQAVRTGKGLAANEVVTGRFGALGRTFVMQAKRLDVETFATLGLASTKFTEGQEDEALNTLPYFAKTLAGIP
jgi:hypothetical protein